MSKIKNIFADLSNPDNYPVYLHCTYGMDRTGIVCYLLELLLGASSQDAELDYDLSALCHAEITKATLISVTPKLEGYAGATMAEKIENYLLACGVTERQIASIRSIFLAEKD